MQLGIKEPPVFAHDCVKMKLTDSEYWDGDSFAYLGGRKCPLCGGDLLVEDLNLLVEYFGEKLQEHIVENGIPPELLVDEGPVMVASTALLEAERRKGRKPHRRGRGGQE